MGARTLYVLPLRSLVSSCLLGDAKRTSGNNHCGKRIAGLVVFELCLFS